MNKPNSGAAQSATHHAQAARSKPGLEIPQELALSMYRTMVLCRVFEERVRDDYRARLIPGFSHSYVGQEAIAAGVCACLEPADYITSTHRGHGHAIAKGVDLNRLMAELYGKDTGVCGGRGGSMHVADFSKGMLGADGIVGGGFGLAVGAGFSSLTLRSNHIVICFFGDGATNKGAFHEGLNVAAVYKLPIVFVCENNHYAQSTAMERMTAVSDLSLRAVSYGIPGFTIDGNDLVAVYQGTGQAVKRARAGDGPSLLNMETYRLRGHSYGDAEPYRSKDEVRARAEFDPIPRTERWLVGSGFLDDAGRASVWAECGKLVDQAAEFASASPEPDPLTALDNLYTPVTRES